MSVDLSGRESARVRNHIAHKFIIHSATWTARRPLAHGREDGRPKDKVLSARRAAKNLEEADLFKAKAVNEVDGQAGHGIPCSVPLHACHESSKPAPALMA